MFDNIKKGGRLEKNRYDLIVIFFVVIQFLIIYLAFRIDDFEILFWFCNHTPFMFALFFYFRKVDLIKSIINVGLLFQFFWTVDFFSKLFFDSFIFGATSYVFEREFGILMLIPILSHLFVTSLSFILTYKYKPRLKSIFYSMIYAIVLYGFSLKFTLINSNVNCVHEICSLSYAPLGYIYLWPVLILFLIIVPTHVIQYLVWKLDVQLKGKGKRVKF